MATYLLTWNPNQFSWDSFDEDLGKIQQHGSLKDSWSCGNTKRIVSGDRLFLMRLGQEPKGIIASGTVLGGSYYARHWDEERARRGDQTLYVDISFDTLLDPHRDAIISQSRLQYEAPFSTVHRSPQSSGTSIPDEVAIELERVWEALIGGNKHSTPEKNHVIPEEVPEGETFSEGATRQILVNAYERNSAARKRCIEHYGYSCQICDSRLADVYGQVAANIIHVHHLKPLSEIGEEYEVDPIDDLCPVCPNCRAVIHASTPPYTIEEVRGFLTFKGK